MFQGPPHVGIEGGIRGLGLGGEGRAAATLKAVNLLVTENEVQLLEGVQLDQEELDVGQTTHIPVHIKDSKDVQGQQRGGRAGWRKAIKAAKEGQQQDKHSVPPIEVGLQLGQRQHEQQQQDQGGEDLGRVGEGEARRLLHEVEQDHKDSQTDFAKASLEHAEAQTSPPYAPSPPSPLIAALRSDDVDNINTAIAVTKTTAASSSQTEAVRILENTENSLENDVSLLLPSPQPRPTSVCIETQTPEVERGDCSSQTEVAAAEVIEAVEVAKLEANPLESRELVEAGVQTEAQQEELRGVDQEDTVRVPPPLPRPPTLPGSSVDVPEVVRTRTVSPQELPVQDDVVARVLLEHVGTAFASLENPRNRGAPVNYLDLSRLGDEGETPASDEIWLAVDGSGHSEDDAGLGDDDLEDKFLTSETETYSVATDKISTEATMAGLEAANGLQQAPLSANLLSEADLGDLGGSMASFDAEAEATARLQGVLAGELRPIQTTVVSTDKNVTGLTDKFGHMENVLAKLCTTVDTLQGQVTSKSRSGSAKQKPSVDAAPVSNGIQNNNNNNNGGQASTAVLDQLVARIEHLSLDVANMDNTRLLKEDNLMLRKELQGYRDREVVMMQRMETMEKKLSDVQSRIRQGRRRGSGSVGGSSYRSTPELPPIESHQHHVRSKSIDSPRSRPGSGGKLEDMPSRHDQDVDGKETKTDGPPSTIDKIVKAPLLAQAKTKTTAKAMMRRTSNSSSSSNETGSGNGGDLKGIHRRKPITPKLDSEFLQSEIQIARSDNSILRQDIQVYRARETQLIQRNKELEDKLINVVSPAPGRAPPIGGGGGEEDKSEVSINIDFVEGDQKTGKGKKVVVKELVKKSDDNNASKPPPQDKKPSKDNNSKPPAGAGGKPPGGPSKNGGKPPVPPKKDIGKDKNATPPKSRSQSKGSSGHNSDNEAGGKPRTPPSKDKSPPVEKEEHVEPEAVNVVVQEKDEEGPTKKEEPEKGPAEESTSKATTKGNTKANGVPKTKPTATTKKLNNNSKPSINAKGGAKTPKGSSSSSAGSGAEDKDKTKTPPKTVTISAEAANKDLNEGVLRDDDQWKVTISFKHELDYVSDSEQKTIVVTPRASQDLGKKQQDVVQEVKKKAATAVAAKKPTKIATVAKTVAKAKTVTTKVDTPKLDRKIVDPRSDPIPKPSQFPSARPPRDYVPPKVTPNASAGVTGTLLNSCSGRASSIDSDSEVIAGVVTGAAAADPIVTNPPPPICQVSYDSVYDVPSNYVR